jgi:uncharacterized membrane protein
MQPRVEPNANQMASANHTGSIEATVVRAMNALVAWVARHWLAIFNTGWALYVLLPFLAPVLMQAGLTTPARLIYALYSVLCHQLPDHSYFLFGPQLAPDAATLQAAGMTNTFDLFAQRRFLGNEQIGFKVAICQRDVAIYSSVLLAGLVFGLVRRWTPPLRLRWYLLLLVPMVIDGGTQLFGLRESNWWLRSLTGGLFGVASVWLAYPFIDDAMQEVIPSPDRTISPQKAKFDKVEATRYNERL